VTACDRVKVVLAVPSAVPWRKAGEDVVSGEVELERFTALAGHSQPHERLTALDLIQRRIGENGPLTVYLDIARRLVSDPDNRCRWQALIAIGQFLETAPEVVWDVIREHGSSADADMRAGIATVLLEHLLDDHFDQFYPQVRREAKRSPRFADTLSTCWFDGCEGWRYAKVQRLLRRIKR
jgi:hypothetical protein